MNDIASRIDVLSPKAGDTIAVSIEHHLTPVQRLAIREALESKLPEGVKVMILEGGMTLTHVESPASANERHELLCEIKALREEMQREREVMRCTGIPTALIDELG